MYSVDKIQYFTSLQQYMRSSGQNKEMVRPKNKIGRWNELEIQLFEKLIEKYGTNWIKINDKMKGRSIAQIRSHAQKYFLKIGQKKHSQLQNKAKYLEARQILEQQNRMLRQNQSEALLKVQQKQVICQANSRHEEAPRHIESSHKIANTSSFETFIKEQLQVPQIKTQALGGELNYFMPNFHFDPSYLTYYPFLSYPDTLTLQNYNLVYLNNNLHELGYPTFSKPQ